MINSENCTIGILAHVDAGKTTLTEALLYKTGAIRKMGRVDHKDTFLDTHYIERSRGITIFSKQAEFFINNNKYTIVDTPGHIDFSPEMERCIRILDYAIIVINGAEGIQSHTETIWKILEEYNVPVIFFINKIDRESFNKENIINNLKKRFSEKCVTVEYENNMLSDEFIETLASTDEVLLEKYFEGTLNLKETISKYTEERKLFPCFFGSALNNIGIDDFIKGINDFTVYKSYDDDKKCRIFKILHDEQGNRLTFAKITGGIWNVKDTVSYDDIDEKINQIRIYNGDKYTTVQNVKAGDICAFTGLSKTKAGKSFNDYDYTNFISPVLSVKVISCDNTDISTLLKTMKIIEEEEPELRVKFNKDSKTIEIYIMGLIQLEILKNTIKERFNINIDFGTCEIIYKETIKGSVMGYGHFEPLRHYAEVHLRIEEGERESGIVIKDECSEDMLDKNYHNLILSHVLEKEHKGILTGSQLTDVIITLVAGKAHLKHTEGGDFREATYRAIRQGLEKAENIILEPYYNFKIEVPIDCLGRVLSDMTRLKCEFDTPIMTDEKAIVKGKCPVALFMDYPLELASYSKGKGIVQFSSAGYFKCHNSEEIIEKINYDKDRDVENTSSSVFCSHGAGYEVKWFDVDDKRHIK